MKNLTIVGPEADNNDRLEHRSKVNIEALFLMAKYDDSFRVRLLTDRVSALDSCGILFTPTERLLLERASQENLENTITRYSMPGIERESLPSWKTAAAVIILVTNVMFGTIACQRNVSTAANNSMVEGWVDEDSFRVMAVGYTKPGLTNKNQRKGVAREYAILMAQKMLIEKFKGVRLEGAGGMSDFGNSDMEFKKYYPIIKAGKIIKETFDEKDNCEIIYEVRDKNLKKQVNGSIINQ